MSKTAQQREDLEVLLQSLNSQISTMWSVVVQNNHGITQMGQRLDRVTALVDRMLKVKDVTVDLSAIADKQPGRQVCRAIADR